MHRESSVTVSVCAYAMGTETAGSRIWATTVILKQTLCWKCHQKHFYTLCFSLRNRGKTNRERGGGNPFIIEMNQCEGSPVWGKDAAAEQPWLINHLFRPPRPGGLEGYTLSVVFFPFFFFSSIAFRTKTKSSKVNAKTKQFSLQALVCSRQSKAL